MKVSIICPFVYPLMAPELNIPSSGGAEAQLKAIGFKLAEEGHDISYVVNDYGQKDCEIINNAAIYKSDLRYLGGSNKNLPSDWFNLWSTLRRIDADVYMLKLPRHLLLPVGLFCRFNKKKLIFIGQIDQDVDLKFIRQQEGALPFWMYRIGIKCVDQIIAQNNYQKKGFESVFDKPSSVIKNTISLDVCPDIIKQGYILWVGNSLQKKQPKFFLKLAQSLPDLKFKMIMAPASGGEHEEVEALAKNIDNLDFIGFVPMEKIAKYYAGADIFISTSLREGFPNTFIQAWQHGTPVISLNVDPDGLIKTRNLGRLSGSLEIMSEDVKAFILDKALREQAGDNALHYVNEEHSLSSVAGKYTNLIKGLLGDA